MAGPRVRVETAETEAAAWHARLGASSVSPQTVEAFFAWRRTPANAEAYRRVEAVWGQAGRLASDPEILGAVDEALGRRDSAGRSRRPWPPAVIGLAAVCAAGALAFGGWTWVINRGVYSTGVGEQRLVQLSDGSSMRLDTASRVRVRFDGERRLLELESGQALFSVAHDTARPFVVQAGEATVTAVGTVFDVRRQAGEARVTLVSGVVDVRGARTAPVERMAAGRQARVSLSGAVVRTVDVETETSWAEGRIVFRDTPLIEAVAEVNRYLTQKVELDAADLAGVEVNGVFRTGDRDAFVSTVSGAFGLQASSGAGGTVRLSVR